MKMMIQGWKCAQAADTASAFDASQRLRAGRRL